MTTYRIETLMPAPSMSHTSVEFTGSYESAVKAAQDSWKETGRFTCLMMGTWRIHYITSDGKAVDANIGSSIPSLQELSR